jgi:hypothetical protein
VLRVLAGGDDFLLGPSGYPGGTDLGPQVDIELIGKDHDLMCLQRLGMKPNLGQAFDPLGIIILGDQLRPFPYPTHLMEPASYGPSGYFKPMFSLEFHGQRGATPARATPTIGMRCSLE